MKKCFAILMTVLLLISSNLFALHRDYKSDCEEDNRYQNYYDPYCLSHAPCNYQEWISSSLAKYIPARGEKCCKCKNKSIYLGYLDSDFRKYRSHFIHQLKYYRESSQCDCYWPEYSSKAAQISDAAYLLFRDLITTTALSDLLENEDKQREFIENQAWFLNKHGLAISFIAQQFRFSDYYHIYKNIEEYALVNYSRRDAAEIKDKLEDILEALYPKFFSLYTACHAKHPSHDIEQEILLMKLLVNDISALNDSFESIDLSMPIYYDNKSYDVSEFIISNLQTADFPVELESKGIKTGNLSSQSSSIFEESLDLAHFLDIADINAATRAFSIQSEILVEEGAMLNSLLLYKKAIEVLTKAIKYNSSNRNAYIERAMAYFETNQIELALKDYEKTNQLAVPPFKQGIKAIYIPNHKKEFATGLIKGALKGAHLSAKELIPSILSCFRGILHGLWAFASTPSQVSQEIIDAAYAIGEFVSSHDAIECLECVVPELKDLSLTWHQLDDYSRGKKIGYMIGKYGVEIFAPLGVIKGIAKFKTLKQANIAYTLERCTVSQSARTKILKKSTEFAVKRESIVQEVIKKSGILIKNANDKHHIMQPKHAWDKLIQISGNIDEDCKKIILLLENHKIADPKYLRNMMELPQNAHIKNIQLLEYKATIEGKEVQIFLEKNLDSGEIFLKNGWIVTK